MNIGDKVKVKGFEHCENEGTITEIMNDIEVAVRWDWINYFGKETFHVAVYHVNELTKVAGKGVKTA